MIDPDVQDIEPEEENGQAGGDAKEKEYQHVIAPTAQFVFCGNCFRADTYRGCNFGCRYCFANCRENAYKPIDMPGNVALARRWMDQALNQGQKHNIVLEMLNRRVPLHLGGMSDPFQSREWKMGRTKEFLKITREFNYPVSISTKVSELPKAYFEILDPKIHTFQISLIGVSADYIRRFETNTPEPEQRINFVLELKERGFWVSIRIQPLIDLEEALSLVQTTSNFVDYYTVEHLKLYKANSPLIRVMLPLLATTGKHYPLMEDGIKWAFATRQKKENVDAIRAVTTVPIGCGDNDLHECSDSLNCCGVDLMPPAFENWFKYNSMYIKMTGDRTQWRPTSNCDLLLKSKMTRGGEGRFKTIKEAVDDYYLQLYGPDEQLRLFGEGG